MEAVRLWLAGDQPTGADLELVKAMMDFGASPDQVAATLAQQAEFYLWPHHAKAWEAFLCICHQWRYTPRGIICALDYVQVEAGWRLAGFSVSASDWVKLRLIEAEVIRLLQPDS